MLISTLVLITTTKPKIIANPTLMKNHWKKSRKIRHAKCESIVTSYVSASSEETIGTRFVNVGETEECHTDARKNSE